MRLPAKVCLIQKGQVSATRFSSAVHIPSTSFKGGKWYVTPAALWFFSSSFVDTSAYNVREWINRVKIIEAVAKSPGCIYKNAHPALKCRLWDGLAGKSACQQGGWPRLVPGIPSGWREPAPTSCPMAPHACVLSDCLVGFFVDLMCFV